MAKLTERQQFYKTHLDAASAEGLTIAEYARRHDVPAHGLYDARRRIQAKSDFVRVGRSGPAPLARLELRLPNGLLVTVVADDLAWVLRAAASL